MFDIIRTDIFVRLEAVPTLYQSDAKTVMAAGTMSRTKDLHIIANYT